MPNKAVFLDRDRTLMEDPGLTADASAVKLLPGVETALKTLAQAGYKLVVVTNQAGVARGLITEDDLAVIHRELQRQLSEKGARWTPSTTARSIPRPPWTATCWTATTASPSPACCCGPPASWTSPWAIVGWSATAPATWRPASAAGCRTIRLRGSSGGSGDTWHGEEGVQDEDVQADFTVRNLVDAARTILRQSAQPAAGGTVAVEAYVAQPAAPTAGAAAPAKANPAKGPAVQTLSDSEVLHELLRLGRQVARRRDHKEFSFTKLAGGILQILVVPALLMAVIRFAGMGAPTAEQDVYLLVLAWLGIAMVLQLAALAAFVIARRE